MAGVFGTLFEVPMAVLLENEKAALLMTRDVLGNAKPDLTVDPMDGLIATN